VFSKSITLRFVASFWNVFVSLILGAVAMGLFWFYLPDEFVRLQRSAAVVREWIAAHAWSTRTETIIRFLLEDRLLLMMSFVLAMRLVLGLLFLPIRALFGRG
jgi:hypothetical protein